MRVVQSCWLDRRHLGRGLLSRCRTIEPADVVVVGREVRIELGDLGGAVPHPGRDLVQTYAALGEDRGEGVPHGMRRHHPGIQLGGDHHLLEDIAELPRALAIHES